MDVDPASQHRIVRWLSHPAAWALAVVMAFLALGLTLFVGFQRYRLADCLAEYNNATSRVTAARVQFAERERRLAEVERQAQYRAEDALDATLNVISRQPGSDAAREAFADLVQVRHEVAQTRRDVAEQRAELEQQRRDHPVPAPPEQQCG